MMQYREEGLIFGRFILRQYPNEGCLSLYEQAMGKMPFVLKKKEEAMLRFMRKHPWSVGLVDAGLAVTDPDSQVRKKMLVMLAILETQPQYAQLFLAKKRGLLYLGYIFLVGCRAVSLAVAGALVVKRLQA